MKPHRLMIELVLVVVAISATARLLSAQDPNLAKTAYVSSGNEAVLSGSVTFTGKPPLPKRIDMSADPACTETNLDPQTEDVVINHRKLANVLIYLKNDYLSAHSFDQPTSPAVLAHKGCQYTPRMLGMRAGQTLNILNHDPTVHNTHPDTKDNPAWNQSQAPQVSIVNKTFSKPELFIRFRCNQHPWERAYLSVFDHPFFAVTDDYGNYRIEGVPPGQYTVVAWHERFGEKTIDIVFVPGESRYLKFTFNANDSRPTN